MDYRDIYADLSQAELRNVAARARMSIEEVRQEALLCCWQIAIGRSDFDHNRGTVRQYLMAKLWGLATRQTELRTVPWCGTEEADRAAPSGRFTESHQASPSILDAMIAGEERDDDPEGLDLANHISKHRYVGVSSTAVLMDQGISSGIIATLAGVTPQAVRQRVARERERLRARSCKRGAPKTSCPIASRRSASP